MITLIIFSTIISVLIYFCNREISTKEFLIMTLAINVSVLIVYAFTLIPFNNDKYFASGRLISTEFHPAWVEEYRQQHTRCTGSGKTEHCYTYWTTEHDHHEPYWTVRDSLGQEWGVDSIFHAQVKSYFGNNKITTKPDKSTHGGHFDGGDPYLYTYHNDTNTYKYPTTKKIDWYNPVLGTDSLFNENTNYVKEYPKALDNYRTNRLMTNKGSDFLGNDWDALNTKAYSLKKVNLIAIQVNSLQEASNLEACWTGGEKNDLVFCVVGNYNNPKYVKVFGWAEKSRVKVDLEQLILNKGLTKEQFPAILNIINKGYEPIDFSQFNYIHKKPPLWAFIISLIIASVVGIVCYTEFNNNSECRED